MSKDRESNESGSGIRFRNQSPSTTKRRSRDREPRSTSEKTHWERDADANTMLITNESSPAIGTNATNTMATTGAGEAADTHLLDDSTGNPIFFLYILFDYAEEALSNMSNQMTRPFSQSRYRRAKLSIVCNR